MTATISREQVLAGIREKFAGQIVDLVDKSPKRVYIEVRAEALVPVAAHIFGTLAARFHTASALDARSHLEILYHFSVESINLLISLRVKLDRGEPAVDSLAPVIKGASWIEREMHELLGIDFRGHPQLKRLLLADEWPEGVCPLRQDYQEWDQSAVRDRGV